MFLVIVMVIRGIYVNIYPLFKVLGEYNPWEFSVRLWNCFNHSLIS